MYEMQRVRNIMKRLSEIRAVILQRYPFWGQLLMHLSFALSSCGTACTDMKRIIFDPDFVDRLDDEELIFLMMHEVMHCALKHCTRGRGLSNDRYNIACDIVVNSNILHSMGRNTFSVDGKEPMHKAPNGKEGWKYSAEEVYGMLMEEKDAPGAEPDENADTGIDSHEIWTQIGEGGLCNDQWDDIIAKSCGHEMCPPAIRKIVEENNKNSQIDWRRLLQDFIQLHCGDMDYTFAPSDRRFTYLDVVLPAFSEVETEEVRNLWFVVDDSGSITDQELNLIFHEVRMAVEQFEHLSGKVSFFDMQVTEPIAFETVNDLKHIQASGGGGTSFGAIFRYMKKKMSENLPTAVIILTDGYAQFPDEAKAMGVPVLWVIADSEVEPPWGVTVHISGKAC